jgi:MFS family permease
MDTRSSHNIFLLCIICFLFTLHSTLPVYVNSSFLARYTSENSVGALYTLSSIATLVGFFWFKRIFSRIGSRKGMALFVAVDIAALVVMALDQGFPQVLAGFILATTSSALGALTLDVMLETYSNDENTGKIRGWFLTAANAAWLMGPLIASFILTNGDYWKLYAGGAVLLLPVLLLALRGFRSHEDKLAGEVAPFWHTVRDIWNDRNIQSVFSAHFLMQVFFCWMVIYAPIYLHSHVGFSWKEIGIMLTLSMLPFILLEAPLGRLADRKYGEKEIMAIGFIITGIATALFSFIPGANLAVWTGIMVATRIGASMIEIMTETYFFKKTDTSKVHIISAFRSLRPLAYIAGPALAVACLFLFDMRYLFIVLALLMIPGIYWSLKLEDTK